MPGLTAWVGLVDIGRIEEGETIYVSGAAGAVGSTAAQIAKLKGLRVIGSAGSPEKVDWLRSLGIEAFDYRETPAKEALADGIDVCFDNVGGAQLEAALNALRPFGRVIACGAISRYNDERPEPGPRNLRFVVTKRLRMQGFIVSDHYDRLPGVPRRGRAVGGRRSSCSTARPFSTGSRTCRRRSPASSAATTRARCSCASGRTEAGPTRVARTSICVEPRRVSPSISKWQTRVSRRRRHGDRAVPGGQPGDPRRVQTSAVEPSVTTLVALGRSVRFEPPPWQL